MPLSWNLGTLTSWKPLGLSRPVTGLLYLLLNPVIYFPASSSTYNCDHKLILVLASSIHYRFLHFLHRNIFQLPNIQAIWQIQYVLFQAHSCRKPQKFSHLRTANPRKIKGNIFQEERSAYCCPENKPIYVDIRTDGRTDGRKNAHDNITLQVPTSVSQSVGVVGELRKLAEKNIHVCAA